MSVERRRERISAISDSPFHPLDLDTEGRRLRKGAESIFVEARKPGESVIARRAFIRLCVIYRLVNFGLAS